MADACARGNNAPLNADSPREGETAALAGHDIDRRQFLRMTAMTSALLLSTRHGYATDEPLSKPTSFSALTDLPPGAVQPSGWLRTWMQKQAAQLGSQLPDISWPFTDPYWKGCEQGESWWPWEQKAYWIDGATRLALVLGDQPLLQRVLATIDYTLDHADPDGYLGPSFFKDPKPDFHRWPQNIFFRSLIALADARGVDGRPVVDAVHRHYLGDAAGYGTPTRNITNLEAMLWCYQQTGDRRLLTKAETAWHEYLSKVASDPEHGDLSSLRVFAATPINAHGVTYAETCKLPAILYNHTGRQEYLQFALAAQRRIFDHHMLVDGIPSTSEWFRTTTALDSHETCDITDHTWSWGYMMMATGESLWGDQIERACFNAAPGAIKNDWKALQYFSCPNQFLATLHSDHNVMEHGGRMMAYQPNPGQQTACCGGNVHRLLPNYVIRMWMRGPDDGLVATLYGPSILKTTIGSERIPVEIVQTTNYPFDEPITFSFHTHHAVTFPLSLRIPAWCSEPHLAINGKSIPLPEQNKGFVTLRRTFRSGDTLTLVLPMKLAVSHWPQNGIAIEQGPLVYALPVQAGWSPLVEPRYTTPEFPSWNALPTSPWNYGLALTAARLEDQVSIRRQPVPDDPWTNPPISLQLPAARIEGWVLQQNPDDPQQTFTPPLPDLAFSKVHEARETITLVPYGSTQLRLTLFPDLNAPRRPV